MDDDIYEYHWRALEDAGQRFGRYDLPPPVILLPQLPLIPKVKTIAVAIVLALAGPGMGYMMVITYLDSALSVTIPPNAVVAGFILVLFFAGLLGRWAFNKFFGIIDKYPQLEAQVTALDRKVDGVSEDIAEIKEMLKKRDKADEDLEDTAKKLRDNTVELEKRIWKLEQVK